MVSPTVIFLIHYCMSPIQYTSGLSTHLTENGTLGQMIIQAYMNCRPTNAPLDVGEMGHVLDRLDTHVWVSSYRLRINPGKAKFMWFGAKQQLAKPDGLANKFPIHTFSATCTLVSC